MIVCICHRISERDISGYAHRSPGSFEDMQAALGAGTRCGRCVPSAQEVYHASLRGHADPRLTAAGHDACPASAC